MLLLEAPLRMFPRLLIGGRPFFNLAGRICRECHLISGIKKGTGVKRGKHPFPVALVILKGLSVY